MRPVQWLGGSLFKALRNERERIVYMYEKYITWFVSQDLYSDYLSDLPEPMNNPVFLSIAFAVIVIAVVIGVFDWFRGKLYHMNYRKKQHELDERRLQREMNEEKRAQATARRDDMWDKYMQFMMLVQTQKMTSLYNLSYDQFLRNQDIIYVQPNPEDLPHEDAGHITDKKAERLAKIEAKKKAKAEKAEAAKLAAEQRRKEAEEKRIERERIAKEKAEKLAEEKRLKEEAERIAAEKAAEEQRIAEEARQKAEAERLEQKRIEKEKAEAERIEKERIAKEAELRAKEEAERIAREEEIAKKDAEPSLPARDALLDEDDFDLPTVIEEEKKEVIETTEEVIPEVQDVNYDIEPDEDELTDDQMNDFEKILRQMQMNESQSQKLSSYQQEKEKISAQNKRALDHKITSAQSLAEEKTAKDDKYDSAIEARKRAAQEALQKEEAEALAEKNGKRRRLFGRKGK